MVWLKFYKVSTGNSRWSQFLEKRQDHPRFLHSLFLLMHSDVLLAFLGSKCYPADSLPTSPSSCSAPENGTEWKGPDIVRSGNVVKRNWVAVRPAQVDGMLGTWTEQCPKCFSHLTHRTLCLDCNTNNNHSTPCHWWGARQALGCVLSMTVYLNHHNNWKSQGFSLFYGQGNSDYDGWRNLPKITELERGRAGIQTHDLDLYCLIR